MRVLVATDLSQPSLLVIDGICSCGPMPFEHVTLVHVIDLDLYTAGGSIPEIQEWAVSQLAEQAERLAACGLSVSTRVEQGDVLERIEAVFDDEGADLVMLTNVGHSAIAERLFGSTAERLATTSRIPVLVERVTVKEERWCRVGDSPFSRTMLTTALDEQLPTAFEFVMRLPGIAQLRIVHAVEDAQHALLAQPLLDALIADGIQVENVAVVGDPSDVIAAEIAAWQPSLVAVTPQVRGVERVLRGSISSKVLNESDAAVLFLPPVG